MFVIFCYFFGDIFFQGCFLVVLWILLLCYISCFSYSPCFLTSHSNVNSWIIVRQASSFIARTYLTTIQTRTVFPCGMIYLFIKISIIFAIQNYQNYDLFLVLMESTSIILKDIKFIHVTQYQISISI